MYVITQIGQGNTMVQFDEIEGGKKEAWLSLSAKVQQFIGRFKKGDEVKVERSEINGRDTITFMTLKGSKSSVQKSVVSEEKVTPTDKLKCEDCGATLKDDTYKTCYTCSMARRKREETSPEGLDKQKSIRAQAIGNMVSRSLISLQGTFDINTIGSLIDTLYEHFERNIKKLEK